VIAMPQRERLLQWLFWTGCGLAVVGGIAALAIPHGGVNRIGPVAVPFALGAAALAILGLGRQLDRWLVLVLYAVPALALTYGLMMVASVPLRLAVLGTCPAAPAVCPVGFEPVMTGGENLALQIAVGFGVAALVVTVTALEVQFRPRLRLFKASPAPAAPPPPPVMKPSAIVRKPPAGDIPPPE
jgi:hypothetical protein